MKTTNQTKLRGCRIPDSSQNRDATFTAHDQATKAPQWAEPALVQSQMVERSASPFEARVQVSDNLLGAREIAVDAGDKAEGSVGLKRLDPENESLMYYTVFGVYEGCADRYASGVNARSAIEALTTATEEWEENNPEADVRVRFCGVVAGDHQPLDDAYARPGWRRDEVLKERGEATGDMPQHGTKLFEYTVITTIATHHVTAKDALDAELAFSAEEVAAVLAGHIVNQSAVIQQT